MTATIRMATPDDAPAVLAIYSPIIEETVISFEQAVPAEPDMRGRIRETIAQFPWLVCEIDGVVAGYVYAGLHRKRAAYQWAAEVTVYIHAEYRGKRIGTALYTVLFALLKAQGYTMLFAGATLPNPGSVRLHESLGFTPVGVYHNAGYKFGAWHDVGWWELPLREPVIDPQPPTPITDPGMTDVMAEAAQVGLALLAASL